MRLSMLSLATGGWVRVQKHPLVEEIMRFLAEEGILGIKGGTVPAAHQKGGGLFEIGVIPPCSEFFSDWDLPRGPVKA